MSRRAVSAIPVVLAFALLSTVGVGDALADLVPSRPAPPPKPAAAAPAKPAAAAPAKPAASAEPAPAVEQANPGDGLAPGDGQPIPEELKQILAIKWQPGPTTGALGDVAEVAVPEGFIFADGDGTRKFLELNQNPTNGSELGMIATPDLSWFVTFDFDDSGYVKDDDKGELDADAILDALKEGTKAGNEARKARGWRTVSLLGWASPPKYDEATNNLEWATKLQSDSTQHVSVNHSIRLLGRRGVMNADLVVSPETYVSALPPAKQMLAGFQFKSGQRYSEWKQGDRVAAIGLTGLITGGALAAAAKSGLLGKLGSVIAKGGKAIIALVAAAGAAIARAFSNKKNPQGE